MSINISAYLSRITAQGQIMQALKKKKSSRTNLSTRNTEVPTNSQLWDASLYCPLVVHKLLHALPEIGFNPTNSRHHTHSPWFSLQCLLLNSMDSIHSVNYREIESTGHINIQASKFILPEYARIGNKTSSRE